MRKIALLLTIAGLCVAAAGCTAATDATVTPDKPASAHVKDKKKTAKADKAVKLKTAMRNVRIGMTVAEVRSIAGKPSDRDVSRMNVMGDTTKLETLTYGSILDKDAWVLSFTDGVLDSKSKF